MAEREGEGETEVDGELVACADDIEEDIDEKVEEAEAAEEELKFCKF